MRIRRRGARERRRGDPSARREVFDANGKVRAGLKKKRETSAFRVPRAGFNPTRVGSLFARAERGCTVSALASGKISLAPRMCGRPARRVPRATRVATCLRDGSRAMRLDNSFTHLLLSSSPPLASSWSSPDPTSDELCGNSGFDKPYSVAFADAFSCAASPAMKRGGRLAPAREPRTNAPMAFAGLPLCPIGMASLRHVRDVARGGRVSRRKASVRSPLVAFAREKSERGEINPRFPELAVAAGTGRDAAHDAAKPRAPRGINRGGVYRWHEWESATAGCRARRRSTHHRRLWDVLTTTLPATFFFAGRFLIPAGSLKRAPQGQRE